jgi:hypothetical protein
MLAGRENRKDDEHVLKFVEQHKVGPYYAHFHTIKLLVTKILWMSSCVNCKEKETALNNIRKLSEKLHVNHKFQLEVICK